MELTLLQTPFLIQSEKLLRRLRIKPGSAMEDEFHSLLSEAQALARPQGAFREAAVGISADEDRLEIAGVPFQGEALVRTIGEIERVYPFIVTCGVELEAWGELKEEPLQRYWASEIMAEALSVVYQEIKAQVTKSYGMKTAAVISPGAMDGWLIDQQLNIFAVLGDGPQGLGVRLTADYLMLPLKTLTGIIFPVDEAVTECAYCTRQDCLERHIPRDEAMPPRSNPSRCNGHNKRSG